MKVILLRHGKTIEHANGGYFKFHKGKDDLILEEIYRNNTKNL